MKAALSEQTRPGCDATGLDAQAAYRASMKRAGALEVLGGVYNLVDMTVDVLWKVFARPAPDGTIWAEAENFEDIAHYRAHLGHNPGLLMATCRDLLWVSHILEPDERAVIQSIVDLSAALDLAPRRRQRRVKPSPL